MSRAKKWQFRRKIRLLSQNLQFSVEKREKFAKIDAKFYL